MGISIHILFLYDCGIGSSNLPKPKQALKERFVIVIFFQQAYIGDV